VDWLRAVGAPKLDANRPRIRKETLMSFDLAMLLLRIVVGVLFIGHGTQKLFGWFGGPGLAGMSGWLASTGMRPAKFWALMAGLSEAGGGLLLALGLLNPLGTLGITA